jgi:hypothetical protein
VSAVSGDSDQRARIRDDTWFQRQADPETYGMIHGGVIDKVELGLRDPILAGILTEREGVLNYQMYVFPREHAHSSFKHHFSALSPQTSLSTSHGSLPTHPFLRAAIFYFVSRCPGTGSLLSASQVVRLRQNLLDNLNAFHSGCRPSTESALAAFILSMLPPDPYRSIGDTRDLEAHREIGLAHGQLREIGYSTQMQKVGDLLESGLDLSTITHEIDEVRIHAAILNRALW